MMNFFEKQKIHFIAIGGSVMHNLAITLHKKGFDVSGSDDEIFEPSRSNLAQHDLLPDYQGWNPDKITAELDAVILGMHARPDNPELKKALDLNLPIFSYPEYIYQQSMDKQRIVIAGSHGKTTITSMIIHVLKVLGKDFDYLVGAKIEGFEHMVKLSDAPVIILEGDEYYSSPLDKTPKFLKYNHHIGLISGIAWDHINVFPTFEEYVKQFDLFADATPKGGSLIYFEEDPMATVVCSKERKDVNTIDYKLPKYQIRKGITHILSNGNEYPLNVFGKHNLQNISGALTVLKRIGVTDEDFYEAINSFKGAFNRLQLIFKGDDLAIYKDFAHAPSKVEATTTALKEQYPQRELVACLELHTFSSLNKAFLTQYQDTMSSADVPLVYYNPKTVEHKKLELINKEDIFNAFSNEKLMVFDNIQELNQYLLDRNWKNKNLLMMSSGNFDGLEINDLAEKIIKTGH
ncbi:MAG: UDP-N-acetylmuramate--L-alanine ligase [Candidatus Cyclobacteriaceae bacterium M3_2C_046]